MSNADAPPAPSDPDAPSASPDADADIPEFTRIDWDEHDPSGPLLGPRTIVFLIGMLAIAAVFVYDYTQVPPGIVLVWGLNPSWLWWLTVVSALVFVAYGVFPLLVNPTLTRRYVSQLLDNRLAALAALYLVVLTFLGLAGAAYLGLPATAELTEGAPRGPFPSQPPAFTSVSMEPKSFVYCAGKTVENRCYGTLAHPLGTTQASGDVLSYLLWGIRVVLQISLITGALLVPLSTAVGTAAAYVGGRVDTVLTTYLDVQQLLPGVLIYLMLQSLFGPSLLAIVVIFGLLDWDRIARQLRSDALSEVSKGYVMAARSAGASHRDVVQRHVIPNLSHSLVSGVTRQLAFVILAETALTYLGLTGFDNPSWGKLLSIGLVSPTAGLFTTYPTPPIFQWWSAIFPVVMLCVTIAALSVLADAFRDVLDPREQHT